MFIFNVNCMYLMHRVMIVLSLALMYIIKAKKKSKKNLRDKLKDAHENKWLKLVDDLHM